MKNEIKFHAEYVEVDSSEYTPNYTVIGIFFGEGDPENGGQHWNFTRSIGDDTDEGVCTVKEIQSVTIYGGIDHFSINSKGLVCEFSQNSVSETKVKNLIITFNISDEKWAQLSEMAKRVFKDEKYFEIDSKSLGRTGFGAGRGFAEYFFSPHSSLCFT
jgi:hypothetical protein